jgi:hypothetical protein
MIGDKVVNVMAALPPSNRETAAKVGNEHADQCVGDEVVGDTPMPCIMGCEHYLML